MGQGAGRRPDFFVFFVEMDGKPFKNVLHEREFFFSRLLGRRNFKKYLLDYTRRARVAPKGLFVIGRSNIIMIRQNH